MQNDGDQYRQIGRSIDQRQIAEGEMVDERKNEAAQAEK